MSSFISFNDLLRDSPCVKMPSSEDVYKNGVAFQEAALKDKRYTRRVRSEFDVWCEHVRTVLQHYFWVNEAEYARILLLPCFNIQFFSLDEYPAEGQRVVSAKTGYYFHLPSDRFSELAPELPEDLVEPLYAIFIDDSNWQLRGFEWPTTSMFWQPQSRRMLASVNYFRQVDGYLVSSLVDMDVSDFASDGTWNQATIQSFTTGVSKDRMREQDILRAIDSFDVFSRHTPRDEEACDALSQYVTEVLRKNNAWDVIEWFGRTNFPVRTNDALTLYELMDLSRNVRRVLSELAVGRDSGAIPQDETITLPGELFIYRNATVQHSSTSMWWDKTGNEGDVVEDEDISEDWLELLARREEVDLEALHKTLRDFRPAVKKLDEEPEKWNRLVDLASQFARNLQTT